jgi:hypothetical protein
MSFEAVQRLTVTICLLIATTTLAQGSSPPESFVAAQFTNPPVPATMALTGEKAKAVEDILGHPYARKEVGYWRAEEKTVWILEARGKTHLITTGFVVQDGCISTCQVLVYRESRGREVRAERFVRQFKGASLTKDRGLNRRIDGITGATISVNAMKNMARLALYLDAMRFAHTGSEPEDRKASDRGAHDNVGGNEYR